MSNESVRAGLAQAEPGLWGASSIDRGTELFCRRSLVHVPHYRTFPRRKLPGKPRLPTALAVRCPNGGTRAQCSTGIPVAARLSRPQTTALPLRCFIIRCATSCLLRSVVPGFSAASSAGLHPGKTPTRARVYPVYKNSIKNNMLQLYVGTHTARALACLATTLHAHRFTASSPSPLGATVNPARCSRFATSTGTSRPEVSLFGVPV